MTSGWLSVFVLIGAVGAAHAGDDPLVGAWEVVWGQYGLPATPVEMSSMEHPVQLKLFASGRFAYVRHETTGAFQAASAGSYTIEGNRYAETTEWSSVPEAIGTRVTFEWRLSGDTLCMRGPIEVVDSQGRTIADVAQMKELMRRAGTMAGDKDVCESWR